MPRTFALITILASAFILGMITVSFVSAQNSAPTAEHSDHAERPFDTPPDLSLVEVETGFTPAQEDDINALIEAFLLNNPEIMMAGVERLQQRQRLAQQEMALTGAASNLQNLIAERNGYVAGANPDEAKVAVIEFFDYHCGFCKQASNLVRSFTQDDPDVLIAFREYPILRPESEIAAAAALAAREQGTYIDFHFAMLNSNGTLSRERILQIAKANKLDVKKLEADMESQSIGNALFETHRIADEMGITGTPTFVIATLDGEFLEVISGYAPERVKIAVENAKRAR